MRSVVVLAGMTVVALGAVGCTASDGGGEPESGGAAASCAYVIDYDGRSYTDVANIDYKRGEELGTATQPPCDDTPGDGDDGSPVQETTAYRIEGLDPDVAIAVGDAPDDLIFVATRPNGELPPEVERLARSK
ncbi:DUF6281 family protein [Streptomyces sp. P17]|uniref:DUF6281 family protein n=1 Tax=Streptomyces sp. P17 TaxID=3074716 RepID=UPI0028F41900|nr:DUF6281 family protein [Streptomyces sp. P17]MDT9699368.1 DUF6281 family protein [Streptomyces sp. P17]